MTGSQPRWFWIALGGVFFLGLVLRVGGSTGELWLDELWSLALVAPLTSASQVFTAIRHENNHYLISLWMWMLGPDRDWWMYRVPSILAGMVAVVAAIRIGLRQSRATAFVAALLFSLSYLAVFYSSEARGYAIAGSMALVGYDCMDQFLRSRAWQSAAGYGIAVVIGMMGNLSFVSVAVALGLWSVAGLPWRERTWKSARQLVGLHAAPVALLGVLWYVDVRHMAAGNGPQLGLWPVLFETISYAFGLPGTCPGRCNCGGSVCVCCLAGCCMARQRDPALDILRRGCGCRSAGAAALDRARVSFPAILPGECVCPLYPGFTGDRQGVGYASAAHAPADRGGLAAWTLGNLLLSVQLWQVGRGHYKDAIEYISANTPGGNAQVGSVQDFRAQLLFGYYEKYLPLAQRPDFLREEAVAQLRPPWLLLTISPYELPDLPARITRAPGLDYVLVKQFPSVKLSGFVAGVYQRADLAGPGVR